MSELKGRTWVAMIFAVGLLSACASQNGCGTAAKPVAVPEPEPQPPVEEPVVAEPEVIEEAEVPDFQELPDGSVVAVDADGRVIRSVFRFGFDESEINSTDFRILQEHAQRLNRNRDQSVVIEGHCDERGTREYNLALGERRALAVQDFLLANGVRPSQMSTSSFGEERPVDTESSEAAWAKNRRVELSYQ